MPVRLIHTLAAIVSMTFELTSGPNKKARIDCGLFGQHNCMINQPSRTESLALQ